MRKFKVFTLLVTLIIAGNSLFAQNINEGKQFLYYEKYNSALNSLNAIVTSNPSNTEAAYWLGQTMISMDNVAGAKALYQKTLMANPNAALILVGMGHIALLENNASDARNRFETAISLTKGRDANVLNAIGRANVNAKNGDVPYAIEKLKTAADINKKNADIYLNLGDAYRKMTDGSNAQLAYQSALAIDPNNARASFMIGRIYQTQGYSQEPIYMKYYNDAITKDPKYAPVYEWLSAYYYNRDINKAKDYLDKYIALADVNSKSCYYQAAYLYAANRNQDAVNKANDCITSGGADVYSKLYGLEAYAYNKLGDSVNSKKYFETYFQKAPADSLGPNDYATYARVLLKFPGNESQAGGYVDKALAMDTIESEKVDFISGVANSYLAKKDYSNAALWYTKVLGVKKNYGKLDLYNAGYNYFRASNYKQSDSIYAIYSQKFPDDISGPYMQGLSEAYIDSTGSLGLAKPSYDKVITMAEASANKDQVKPQLINAYRYMVAYSYNVKKDKTEALAYTEKILALDPTDTQALENKKALSSAGKMKEKTAESKEKSTATKTKVKEK